jgi:hypothetical protein
MFSGKNQNGDGENEVSMTYYNPQHRLLKLALAQFQCNFLLFLLSRKFLSYFEMPSRLFFL